MAQGNHGRTRQKDCIFVSARDSCHEYRKIDYGVAKYWNKVPNKLKCSGEVLFNREVKKWLMDDIKNKVQGEYEDKYF